MKKTSLIAVPFIVIAGVITALLLLDSRHEYAWEDNLEHYLIYLRATGQPSYQLVSAVPSSKPANFTPQMSDQSFSDSIAFQTSQISGSEYAASLQAMPYPPAELWCLLLKDGHQEQLIYMALHNNLQNADWVVHIPSDPWGSLQLQSNLQNLGCTFDL
jgi:hypothetical protein